MVKYSVIIPIYNMEKYLNDCIQSVTNQNRNDIELILVNDGSVDKSLEICEKFRNEYDYITILNKRNTGTTDSVMKGVEIARGQYTCFIDADDMISNNFFDVIDKYTAKEYDIIIFDHIKMYKNSFENIKQNNIEYGEIDTTTLNNIKTNYFSCYEKYSLYRWDKVIKTEIIKKSIEKIDVRPIYLEDHIISLLNLINSQKVIYIEDSLYYYRVRKNSVSHTVNEKIFNDWFDVKKTLYKICSEQKYSDIAMDYLKLYFDYQYSRYSLKSNNKHRDIKISFVDIMHIKGKEKKVVLLLYKFNLKKLYQIIYYQKNNKEKKNERKYFE